MGTAEIDLRAALPGVYRETADQRQARVQRDMTRMWLELAAYAERITRRRS